MPPAPGCVLAAAPGRLSCLSTPWRLPSFNFMCPRRAPLMRAPTRAPRRAPTMCAPDACPPIYGPDAPPIQFDWPSLSQRVAPSPLRPVSACGRLARARGVGGVWRARGWARARRPVWCRRQRGTFSSSVARSDNVAHFARPFGPVCSSFPTAQGRAQPGSNRGGRAGPGGTGKLTGPAGRAPRWWTRVLG